MMKSFRRFAKTGLAAVAVLAFVATAAPVGAQLVPPGSACIELFGSEFLTPQIHVLAGRLELLGADVHIVNQAFVDDTQLLLDLDTPNLCGTGIFANIVWIVPRTPEELYLGAFFRIDIGFNINELLDNILDGVADVQAIGLMVEEPHRRGPLSNLSDALQTDEEFFVFIDSIVYPRYPYGGFASVNAITHPLTTGFNNLDLPANLDTVSNVFGSAWSRIANDRLSTGNPSILAGIFDPVQGLGGRILFTSGDFSGIYSALPNGSPRYLVRVVRWLTGAQDDGQVITGGNGVPLVAFASGPTPTQICSTPTNTCQQTADMVFRRTFGGSVSSMGMFFTMTGDVGVFAGGVCTSGDYCVVSNGVAVPNSGGLFFLDPLLGQGFAPVNRDTAVVTIIAHDDDGAGTPVQIETKAIQVVSNPLDEGEYVPAPGTSTAGRRTVRIVQNDPLPAAVIGTEPAPTPAPAVTSRRRR